MTKEELFNQNTGLAYKLAQSYKKNYPEEYEDICQIALEALWTCILNYDGVHKLSTYAYWIIPRKINYYLRKVKRNRNKNVSIFTPIKDVKEEIELIDMLVENYDLENEVIENVDIGLFNELLTNLYFANPMHKEVFNEILSRKNSK